MTGKQETVNLDNIFKASLNFTMGTEGESAKEIETFIDWVEFSGFSAEIIAQEMLKAAEGDVRDLESDLARILIMVSTRGTRLERKRIQDTMDERGRTFVSAMIKKYDIKKTPKTKTTVTWARISSAFSLFELRLRHKHIKRMRVTGEIDSQLKAFAFPAAAGLFPKDPKYDAHWRAFLDWAVSFDAIINTGRYAKEKGDGTTANAEKAREMATMIRENSPISEDNRKDLMERFLL